MRIGFFTLSVAVAVCLIPSQHVAAQPLPRQTTVTTLPHVAGFTFDYRGKTYRTGPDGTVKVPGLATGDSEHLRPVRSTVPLSGGGEASFDRWYDSDDLGQRNVTAALTTAQPVLFRFSNLQQTTVPRASLGAVRLVSSTGRMQTLPAGQDSALLLARRVVHQGKLLTVQEVSFTLRMAELAGRSVLPTGPVVVFPARQDTADITLAFAASSLRIHDALFGFGLGRRVHLSDEGGWTQTLDPGDNGWLALPGLAPGHYRVSVEGTVARDSGTVTIPQSHVLDLAVITWADVVAVILGLLLIISGILLCGRRVPRIRPRLARPYPDAPVFGAALTRQPSKL